jgi:uncharacterized protein YkwD
MMRIITHRISLFVLLIVAVCAVSIQAQVSEKSTSASAAMQKKFYAPSSNPPRATINQGVFHAPSSNPPVGVASAKSSSSSKSNNQLQSPTAQTLFSHGDPTAEEQQILEYINRARSNPNAEGQRLAGTTDSRVIGAYNYFKIDLNKLKQQFSGYPARAPLAFHRLLINSSRVHCEDMKKNNYQGHDGSDGSNPGTRMQRAGYTNIGAWGENVAAYSESPWHAHCGLNVDWGEQNQIDLGHRHNIMNFANTDVVYNEVGIGAIAGAGGGSVGPLIVTQNFTRSGVVYVLGVVYRDRNNNNFYDVGEGISGVTITPSRGNFYAVSSASGGYAIPMTGVTGSVTLTASGNGVNEVKSVNVSNENIKTDFGQATTPQVMLFSPKDGDSVRATATKLVWLKMKNAITYHVQFSDQPDFSTITAEDSTLKDTTYSIKDLTNGGTYFWQVRAKTNLGWGEFSPPFMFGVYVTPSKIALISPPQNGRIGSKKTPFVWNQSSPSVDSYWFMIGTDSTFDLDIISNSDLKDTTYIIESSLDTAIKEGQTYWWKVNAFNVAGEAGWSESRSFRFITLGVDDTELTPIELNAPSPNPSNGESIVLKYTVQKAGKVIIDVCDMNGSSITTLSNEYIEVGSHQQVMNLGSFNLPQGSYFIRLQIDGVTTTKRLIIQR